MFAVIRTISPYTGADLFLGLFSSRELAVTARAEYLQTLSGGDPWAQQAYRTVDPEQDVHIKEVENRCVTASNDARVFLVVAHIEGMGQVVRRPIAFFASSKEARECGDALERGSFDEAPNWCDVEEVLIDRRVTPTMPPNTSLERTRGR